MPSQLKIILNRILSRLQYSPLMSWCLMAMQYTFTTTIGTRPMESKEHTISLALYMIQ